MGHRCCSKQKVKRGLWSPEEDDKLVKYITTHGHGSWSSVPKLAGLQRCGKSCRLRWINYLRPDLKRGSFTAQEEQIIIDVHRILGNRWAQIAKHLPGRTDNEVKNFWNSCIKKKLISQGLDPKTHNLFPSHQRAASSSAASSVNINKHLTISCNNASQSHQQVPFSIITVNSHPSMEAKLPPIPSQPPNTTSVFAGYQNTNTNPNALWSTTCNPSNFTPINSSSSFNSSGFGIIDETCLWTSAAVADEHLMGGMEAEDQGQKNDELGKKNKCFEEIDASFDSSSFDLEFVESTLMSASICRDFNSAMDDLAWNF